MRTSSPSIWSSPCFISGGAGRAPQPGEPGFPTACGLRPLLVRLAAELCRVGRVWIYPLFVLFAVGAITSAAWVPTATALTPKQRDRAVATGLQQSLDARAKGQFKAAFDILGQLAARFPKQPRVHHELGVLYAIHGQFNLAANQLKTALRLDRSLVTSRRGLAEVLRAANRCGDALPHYTALMQQPRQRAVALRGLALCRAAVGDEAGGRAALARLVRDYGDTAAGRWAKTYLGALRATPTGHISAAHAEREGLAQFRAKRYSQAAAWFELACTRGPSADRCYRLGVARLGERDYLAAALAFRLALRLQPKHLPTLSAWPTAARKLRHAGRGGAVTELAVVAGQRPALRVAAALIDDDLLLAEQLASAAMAAGHKGRVLRLLRAEARLRKGQLSRAQADLRVVLRAKPKLAVARYVMAATYAAQGRIDLARRFAGLPPVARLPPGLSWPKGVDANAVVHGFLRWRRAAMDRQLHRLTDPGLKPYPGFVPPPALDPEALLRAEPRETTEPAVRDRSRRRSR